MEGVTDAPMRTFLTERGGFSFCVTEFMRISQDVPYLRPFYDHVPELKHGALTPSGTPVQFQLLGGNPEKLALASQRAVQAGAQGVDLNFGCPSPTVNGNDGGATLLKYPDRIRAIVQAVRQAVPAQLPVSAKLRLGWDTMDAVHLNAERAAEGGASWITIHGRTKEQGYRPPAFWGPIGEINRRMGGQVPIVANGDIWTIDDFERCRDETGCIHFMLGRSAMADPFLPLEVARRLGLPNAPAGTHDPEAASHPRTWIPLFERFDEICKPYYGPGYRVRRIKQWLAFVRGQRKIAWFDDVKRMESTEEVLEWLRQQPEATARKQPEAPGLTHDIGTPAAGSPEVILV
jgi:tRNA-dihydrouridine synthase C